MKRGNVLLLPVVLLVLFSGCGKTNEAAGHDDRDDHDHAEHDGHGHAGHDGGHDHEDESAPARFTEDRGLQLDAETFAALGVRTAKAELRPVVHAYEVTASVFEAGPPARATAFVASEVADDLEKHPPSDVNLISVRRDLSLAVAQVEVVFEVPGAPAVGSTLNLVLRGASRESLSIPRGALLRTATGTFVYVANGAGFLRTPVKPGASDGGWVEITEGLRAGDLVVSENIEQLWLTELRLTKGGGHSH